MAFSLVILAAGFGSRYGGLKQLDGFGPNNEPIILYSVYDAIRAGCDHVVFIIREEFQDAFREKIGELVAKKVTVDYVFQTKELFVPEQFTYLIELREKPRGTAHATLVARDVINQPFLVINADDYYGVDAYKQSGDFLQTISPTQIGMVGYVFEKTISPFGSINRGVCEVSDGKLIEVVERLKITDNGSGRYFDSTQTEVDKNAVVSMNFWCFHPSIFLYFDNYFTNFLQENLGQGEYFIPLVVDVCIHSHAMSCHVMMSHDKWCGVSYQEDKPFVQESIATLHTQGVYPDQLFA